MARAKLSEEAIERMIAAVLAEAKANEKLQELLAATLKKLRETNPKAAHAALRAMIETIAASMPEDKRQTFLNELMGFVRPN
jgi:hypothetical protein